MKPGCRSVQPYLSDYMDCTLSGRQTVVVAQHLRSCRLCRREVESLRRTKTLLNLYIPPNLPDFYDDQFLHQLERSIENSPRSAWWEANLLWQSLIWRWEDVCDRLRCFWGQQFGPPIQWVCRRVRYAPVYVWVLLATFASLSAYQLLQPQEKHAPNPTSLRHSLSAPPFRLTHVQENRELIRNRERVATVVQFFPEAWERATLTDTTRENVRREFEWEGYISRFVSDSDALKAVSSHEVSSDFLAFAQLSSPDSIGTREDFARPLGAVTLPFSAKVERLNDRSTRFAEMLKNVSLPSLSIIAVYDSIKL